MFTTCAIVTEDLNMNVLLIKNFTKVQKIIVLFLKHVYNYCRTKCDTWFKQT